MPVSGNQTGKGVDFPSLIRKAEHGSRGKIHLHLTRRLFESNPLKTATKLFQIMELPQEAVLLHFNTRRKIFAVVGGNAWKDQVPSKYFEDLGFMLSEDLASTSFENAVSLAIQTLSVTLKKNFPLR